VGRGAPLHDVEEFVGRDKLLAFEDAPDGLNGLWWQLGQVGQRPVLDLAALTIALSQQDGRR